MGSFVFKWAHPASEVYITGTFDGWKKTEKLDRVGDHFEKRVELSDASRKIYYKFVVDGNWVTDHTAPKETDESGNENNVLTPERIVTEPPATSHIMSGVTPNSTTAALAASAPLEKESKDFQTEGLPGLYPETPAADLNKQFSINPLPAAPGAVNPISLAPGEKIPDYLSSQGTHSNVRLDPESYEKADSLPEFPAGGIAAFSSAAPTSTTAELAAGAPIETKAGEVPAIVKESQEKAHVEPEASAIPEEVREKAAVESELLNRVSEAPTTSEGIAGVGTQKTENTVTAGEVAASLAVAATALGGAAVAGVIAAKNIAVDKGSVAAASAHQSATQAATNLPESYKAYLPEAVQNAIGTTSKETTIQETAPAVPVEVKESLAAAHQSPEAAASAAAVQDKAALEEELLSAIKPAPAIGESTKNTDYTGEPTIVKNVTAPKIENVAAIETDTFDPKTKEPENVPVNTAGDSALANAGKTAIEPLPKANVAQKSIAASQPITETANLAPVTETATPAAITETATPAPVTETATPAPTTETTTTSAVANGTGASTIAATPATPAKPAASASKSDESPATTDKKKKNRISAFFGKFKDKGKK